VVLLADQGTNADGRERREEKKLHQILYA